MQPVNNCQHWLISATQRADMPTHSELPGCRHEECQHKYAKQSLWIGTFVI
jgi:hypothetical protein